MVKNKKGTCHLCGKYGKLSFEHLPPEKAFNNCRVEYYNYFMGITEGDYNNKISQKGLGRYTLCESCNNSTGSWYGGAFIDWALQSMNILKYTDNQPSLYYRLCIFPLRVIKQIACMMFSVNTDEFRCYHQDLVKFVLEKKKRYLSPNIRFFAFYNAEGFRMSGGMVKVKTNNFNMNSLDGLGESVDRMRTKIETHHAISELGFPPLGYGLTFESELPDPRLVDISYFAKYRYEDQCSIELQLPVLPVDSPYPTDYRTRQEMEKVRQRNKVRKSDPNLN